MREIVATLSSKGQVTIPSKVRKHLNLKEGDTLAFIIEGERSVRIVAVPHYRGVAALKGTAGAPQTPRDGEEMIQIAREDHVKGDNI